MKTRTLMISGDGQTLTPQSAVHRRLLLQAAEVDWLEVFVPHQKGGELSLGDHGVVRGFPGGKLAVFFAMLLGARGRPFDIITAQDPFLLGFIAWRIARRSGARLQLQLHTNAFSPAYRTSSFSHRIRAILARFLLRRADCVRVVSPSVKEQLAALRLRAPVSVLPIFIDEQAIERAPVAALHAEFPQFDTLILIAARLEKEKHIDTAVHAMPDILKGSPRTGLLIAGEGSEGVALEAMAASLGISSNVIFLGHRTDIYSLYKGVDLVIAATAPYEGYGAAAVEALAAGVAVVSEDIGIAKEAGATIATPATLASVCLEILRSRARGRLLFPLPRAEVWAARWKENLLSCL